MKNQTFALNCPNIKELGYLFHKPKKYKSLKLLVTVDLQFVN